MFFRMSSKQRVKFNALTHLFAPGMEPTKNRVFGHPRCHLRMNLRTKGCKSNNLLDTLFLKMGVCISKSRTKKDMFICTDSLFLLGSDDREVRSDWSAMVKLLFFWRFFFDFKVCMRLPY